jgi:hypothetical protein
MSHPFRKTTTRKLRKLLQDDRERNQPLSRAPENPDTDPSVYPIVRIQPVPPQQIEISTESR